MEEKGLGLQNTASLHIILKTPALDGFCHKGGGYVLRTCKVGNGAGNSIVFM